MSVFYNHPDFIAANSARVAEVTRSNSPLTAERQSTLHSPPIAFRPSMAQNCNYEHQLGEACRLMAAAAGVDQTRWKLVYQSRSGRPGDPWLEPDILDHLKDLNGVGSNGVLIHPIGFLSDHIEVLYDLDEEARMLCESLV